MKKMFAAFAVFLFLACQAPLAWADDTVPNETWLDYVNYYRAMAGLPPVIDNPAWGLDNVQHAIYNVKNNRIQRTEDLDNQWYTPEGKIAAESSNLYGASYLDHTYREAIDSWMRGPFEAVGILDPELMAVGYGQYSEATGRDIQMAAGLDVIRGLVYGSAAVPFPVMWPADGQILPLTSFRVGLVDPRTSCPEFGGLEQEFGQAVILQLGAGEVVPEVTGHSLVRDGMALEHCLFDETTYYNPDENLQYLGRVVLDIRDAIILIPRDPLIPGATYTASISANGQTYTWSFTVSETAQGAVPSEEE